VIWPVSRLFPCIPLHWQPHRCSSLSGLSQVFLFFIRIQQKKKQKKKTLVEEQDKKKVKKVCEKRRKSRGDVWPAVFFLWFPVHTHACRCPLQFEPTAIGRGAGVARIAHRTSPRWGSEKGGLTRAPTSRGTSGPRLCSRPLVTPPRFHLQLEWNRLDKNCRRYSKINEKIRYPRGGGCH
jgi:hypothetical protein